MVKIVGRSDITYENYKKLVGWAQQTIKFIHDVDTITKDIPSVNDKVKRLENSKGFKIFEKGVDFTNKINGVIDRTQGLKIKNVVPLNKEIYDRDHKEGIKNALRRRNEILNEENMARDIVNKFSN